MQLTLTMVPIQGEDVLPISEIQLAELQDIARCSGVCSRAFLMEALKLETGVCNYDIVIQYDSPRFPKVADTGYLLINEHYERLLLITPGHKQALSPNLSKWVLQYIETTRRVNGDPLFGAR